MRRFLSTLFLFAVIALQAMAQYTTDGYYRVRNCGRQRYAYVTDNTGNYDVSRDIGDFSALQLWRGLDRAISDPGSIIYIKKISANQYDLQSQHTGIYQLVSRYVDVQETSNQRYTVSATEYSVTKYLTDNETTDIDDGIVGTSGKLNYRLWEVLPVSSSTDNYFGITPTITCNGKYYYPFYADLPFTMASSGMKAYIITKVDAELNLAVYSEITGTIPASTPVLIECSSALPTDNRLNLTTSTATAPAANLLKGVYFYNTERASKSANAVTTFDSKTMRVLGLTSDGKLGFVNSSSNIKVNNNIQYLPANQAYLPVSVEAGSQLTLVTQDEYDQALKNRTYTITYTVDGQVYKTQEYQPSATITPEAAPIREGFTFSGWNNLPSTMPSQNITVTGSFTINSYTLTFVLDGQTYKSSKIAYGTSLTTEAAPVKEGYTFSGWSEVPAIMPSHDVTVTGSFSINSYTLTYVLDGQTYKSSKVVYGTSLTVEAAPTKEGYTFSGWSEIPATMPAHDVAVSGSFSINSYTISYMVQDEVYHTQTIAFGSAVTSVDAPTREGYTFVAWDGIPATMPAHDVTVTARYNVNSYTITYLVDDVTYQTVSVPYGTSITALDAPVKEGYAFSGWSEIPATMPARNISVSGTFSICTYTLTYVLRGGGYNDEMYKTSTYKYGASITPLTVAPVVTGYTFVGYDEIPATMPSHDVIIYGTYEANTYTITYTVDGVEYRKDQVQYGQPVPAFDNPVKEGYTFSGWSNLPATMPAQDILAYGSFSINSYKLTYVYVYGVNGGIEIYRQSTVRYGAKITAVSISPSKTGYTFHGWNKVPSTMPASDVTIYGNYEPNRYTITYIVGDKVVHTESVAYGEEIPEYIYVPEDGKEFLGWNGTKYTTMPARDLTYTADIDDAITAVTADAEVKSAIIYDLNGQRVAQPKRSGIYVVNGKKIYIKRP